MAIRQVSLHEAIDLILRGHAYLDVRSEPEFEAGHPPGAFNVPLHCASDYGLEPNQDFLRVIQNLFPTDSTLVVGCKVGGRSRRAAEILSTAGYHDVADLSVGWEGRRDAFGRLQPGWSRSGLPVETGQPEDRSWTALRERGRSQPDSG